MQALEFLLVLGEKGRGFVRKQKEYAVHVVQLAFSFLLDLQDDIATLAQDNVSAQQVLLLLMMMLVMRLGVHA